MAKNTLGSVVLSLAVDTARFQGDLGRAAAVAEARMRNIKDTASKALGALTIYATAAGAALTVALKSSIQRADDMRDMAQAAGVTVEQLSRLAFAGKQSGVEIELIGKALAKLSKGGAVNANQALMDLADQFSSMPDGAIKTALAVEKFGERIGPYLIPLLNQGSIGLRQMADEADRLGVTISTATANAADQFNDKLTELRGAVDGLVNSMAADLLPLMVDLITEFKNAATQTERLTETTEKLRAFFNVIVTVGYSAYKTLEQVGLMIGGVAATIGVMGRGDFGVLEVWRATDERMKQAIADGDKFLDALWRQRTEAEKLMTGSGLAPGGHNRKPFVSMFGMQEEPKKPKATKAAQEDLWVLTDQAILAQRAWMDLGDTIESSMDAIGPALSRTNQENLEAISAPIAESARQWTAFADEAARNMQSAFADFLFDPFEDGLKGMLSSFVETVRRMVAELLAQQVLSSFFGWAADATTGGMSSFFGQLAGRRAEGGPVSPGGAYLVGERGPELLMMGNRGGHVVPNGKMGGEVVVNHTVNVDARGATQDVIKALPGILAENNRRLIEVMRDARTRGAMA